LAVGRGQSAKGSRQRAVSSLAVGSQQLGSRQRAVSSRQLGSLAVGSRQREARGREKRNKKMFMQVIKNSDSYRKERLKTRTIC